MRTTQASRTHRCPGRCGRHVPASRLACPSCTDRLPDALSVALDRAWGPAVERARQDARDWLLAHPAPTSVPAEDARIGGVCEHCDAELLWLTAAADKRMPVNAAPDPDRGNVVRSGPVAGVLGASQAAAARAAGTRLWLHHTVTCPHADRWHTAAATARRKAHR